MKVVRLNTSSKGTPPYFEQFVTNTRFWHTKDELLSVLDWTPAYIEQCDRYTWVLNVSSFHCIYMCSRVWLWACNSHSTDGRVKLLDGLAEESSSPVYIYIYQQLGIMTTSCFIIEADLMRKLQDWFKVHAFFSHLETMSALCRGSGWW